MTQKQGWFQKLQGELGQLDETPADARQEQVMDARVIQRMVDAGLQIALLPEEIQMALAFIQASGGARKLPELPPCPWCKKKHVYAGFLLTCLLANGPGVNLATRKRALRSLNKRTGLQA